MILVTLLYMISAFSFDLSKLVLEYYRPLFAVGIRMIIAGIILLGFQAYRHKKITVNKKEYPWLIGIIIFHIIISYAAEFIALEHMTAAKACLLYSLSPFITAFIAFFMGERLTLKQWVGLIIGFLGFIPIIVAQAPTEGAELPLLHISNAEILLLISIVSACIGWIIMKKLVIDHQQNPIVVNGIGMFIGGLILFAAAFIFEKPVIVASDSLSFNNVLVWGAWYTALLILLSNIIFYNLYGHLLRVYTATFLSFAGFTAPIFAALFEWLIFKKFVSWSYFVTLIIVTIGLYIFYQDELSKRVIKNPHGTL